MKSIIEEARARRAAESKKGEDAAEIWLRENVEKLLDGRKMTVRVREVYADTFVGALVSAGCVVVSGGLTAFGAGGLDPDFDRDEEPHRVVTVSIPQG